MRKEISKEKIKAYILLHILLLVMAFGGVCSKLAGQSDFLSTSFFLYYGLVLLILAIYAIAWQQILKIIPLVTAYANKAVGVIWGLVFGLLIFQEKITATKVIGTVIIIFGIIMVVKADEE